MKKPSKSKKPNELEAKTKQKDVSMQEIPITKSNLQKDTKTGSTCKNSQKKQQMGIKNINIILTLCFSFTLVMVSIGQYRIYNRQADIAENANQLVQYQYRFEFYKKLEGLQKEVAIIRRTPQLDIEEYSELNYKILSLYRESALLFDESISKDINEILENHLDFLMKLLNTEMLYDDYKKEMNELNAKYGEFINSDKFKEYININLIQ